MKKQYIWIAVTCIWIGIIFSFSLQSGEMSGTLSGSFLETLLTFLSLENFKNSERIEILHTILRKCAHFSEYFILGILSSQVFNSPNRKRKFLLGTAFCIAVAFVDETIQYFVPERAAKVFDVLLDGVGALAGISLVVLISYISEKNIKKI